MRVEGRVAGALVVIALGGGLAGAQKDSHGPPPMVKPVPEAPPASEVAQPFRDKRFGVRFEVPAGWNVSERDGTMSTFHLDARSAAPKSEMRAVAGISFNPFPFSTFSGALFYYSVQRHTNDHECALQAYSGGEAARGTESIGGMDFEHGHDQHGGICVESRDEVYTAYRKGSCYRFDLTVHTFCSVSSGAMEMSQKQFEEIQGQMGGILASVKLDWGPVRVEPKVSPERKRLPVAVLR